MTEKRDDLYTEYVTLLNSLGMYDEAYEKISTHSFRTWEGAGMMYYYDQPADMILYQGLAKEKLADRMGANARFYRLLHYGEKHLRDIFKMDYFAVSMPDMSVFDADMTIKNEVHCYYLMGLANLGLGKKSEAVNFFKKVIAMDNTHQNAYIYLKMAEA